MFKKWLYINEFNFDDVWEDIHFNNKPVIHKFYFADGSSWVAKCSKQSNQIIY